MPQRRRVAPKVLKAVSSALRLRMLRLLSERGPQSYTEIMNCLKLSPSRDAGRFAYHLKTLIKMDLMEPDVETRKYRLTGLGKMIIEFADELDENAYKNMMLVRTSRLAIESFDRNKIADSLVREAEVPIDLAQKIARQAEKRLLKLDTKYLTAPLIREFVNAILIERGLEEYRHKLTRLGLPVYDVTQLIKSMSLKSSDVEAVHEAAGDAVIEEYTLLNVLPRDVADAHLSGAIHLNNLGCWILNINGFMHDVRFFFKHGLIFEDTGPMRVSIGPPISLGSALSLLVDALKLTSKEICGEQAIDYFNLFLAPFVKGLKPEEIKEQLRLFLLNVNLTVPTGVSLGLEVTLPGFLAEIKAIGSGGQTSGIYADYVDESRLISSLILDLMLDGGSNPIFNPCVILKIRKEVLSGGEGEETLYKAHKLAAEKGLPYFANLNENGQMYASYAATGLRFAADWRGDWELDTIRTGNIDSVTLNLPRAHYDAEEDKSKFFENVYDLSEMALRALEMKYLTIRQRAKEGLLPFLLRGEKRDPYSRLENATRLLSFVGLNETVQSITGKAIYESKDALNLAEKIMTHLSKVIKEHVKRYDARFALSMTPDLGAARRLAELDIEKYGLGKVRIQSAGDEPSYTNMMVVPPGADIPLDDRLNLEGRFHKMAPGSHLVLIPLRDSDVETEDLLSTTRKIVNNYTVGLYAYNRDLTYCTNCQRTFHGDQPKCPFCGSVNAVTWFQRDPARYKARRRKRE